MDPMQYMIIETFNPDKLIDLYKRFEEKGRMLPAGVLYINSWIDEKIRTCYQVMESDTRENLEKWISHWNDLADFEVIPVISSVEARGRVLKS
jgi:hypothetical protein